MPRNGESDPNASGQAAWGASVRAPLFVFSYPFAGLDVCLSAAERSDAALVSRLLHIFMDTNFILKKYHYKFHEQKVVSLMKLLY